MSLNPDTYPVLAPGVEVNETDAGAVLRHRESETYLFLSETQYDIISLCTGTTTLRDVVRAISEKYGVEEERVWRDMEVFMDALRDRGMIALSPLRLPHPRLRGKRDVRSVRNVERYPSRYARLHVIALILTEMCPLECSYCFMALEARRKEREDVVMPPDVAERLLRESYELGARTLILSGGELTAYPWADRVVSSAYAMGYRHVRTSTKGIGVTREWADRMFAAGIRAMQVSIDTLNPETYRKMIPRGSVEAAVEGIMNLLESGIEVFVRTTVTRENIEDIPEMWLFLHDLGVSATRGVVVTPEGRADMDLVPSAEEMRMLRERVERAFSGKIGRREKSTRRFLWDIVHFRNGQPDACGAGIFSLTMYPNGWVTLCDSARRRIAKYPDLFVFGNFREQSIADIWYNSPVLDRYRRTKFRDECRGCPLLYDCMGGCPIFKDVIFGNVDDVSPLCTRVYPYYADGRRREEGGYYGWESVKRSL
jgi:radical SAM protein with 4Fe4S-binding SPASM domain